MWFPSLSLSLSLKISYCLVLTLLLVKMWDGKMPTWCEMKASACRCCDLCLGNYWASEDHPLLDHGWSWVSTSADSKTTDKGGQMSTQYIQVKLLISWDLNIISSKEIENSTCRGFHLAPQNHSPQNTGSRLNLWHSWVWPHLESLCRGTWVAQSVKHLSLGVSSGLDLRVELKPRGRDSLKIKKKSLCRCNQITMGLYWSIWASTSHDWYPYKNRRDSHTEQRPRAHGSRRWRDISTSQRTPWVDSNSRNRKRQEGPSRSSLLRKHGPVTSSSQTSGLRDSESIFFVVVVNFNACFD